MIDFGYGISPSSAINLDKFDRTRFEELAREEPDVLKCMACGSCAALLPYCRTQWHESAQGNPAARPGT